MSDPFQPAEKEIGVSLELLKLFKETQYPFIVSTKGKLCIEEPYISLLAECNCVVQISMACSKYDRLEIGAPTYEERVEMSRKLNEAGVKRIIARIQPYLCECFADIKATFPRLKEAGVYGVTLEGMKFKRSKPGLVKVGGDWCYPVSRLELDYARLKKAAHEAGLAFFCAENRLRPMGDSTACCGCAGLEGFEGNRFNVVNINNGEDVKPNPAMLERGTGSPISGIHQKAGVSSKYKNTPLAALIVDEAKKMEW